MKNDSTIKRVAIIGSQGVPPKYGGFETLVDNIVANTGPDIEYTVFCSSPDMGSKLSEYKGAKLKYIGLHAHGIFSVPYDVVSLCKSIRKYDAVLILGVSGGIFLPLFKLFSRAKVVVNIDGLEFMREKWGKTARKYLKYSLNQCIRFADIIVSDNKGIQDFVKREYGKDAKLIAYGGGHANRQVDDKRQKALLEFYGLKTKEYDLSICRIEPENNCGTTLEAYDVLDKDIVFVGNWNHSDYSRELYTKYKNNPRIHLIDSIYDRDVLYTLRNNARRYIHGHRAGGTNPSLVEALQFDLPVICFDVIYNRETTFNLAYYYNDCESLQQFITQDNLENTLLTEKARSEYDWNKIARQYESLY